MHGAKHSAIPKKEGGGLFFKAAAGKGGRGLVVAHIDPTTASETVGFGLKLKAFARSL